MGRKIEAAKWTWRNKKWVIPTAGALGLVMYFGGQDALEAAARNTPETVADSSGSGASAPEHATQKNTAHTIAGLACKKTTVTHDGGRQTVTVETNEAMPVNASVTYTYRAEEDDKLHYGSGDRGAQSVVLSDNHGEVHYVDPTITLRDKKVDCPAWQVAPQPAKP
jgi:hypothetical protein